MTQKDIFIAIIGTFILFAIGGLIMYPKNKEGVEQKSPDPKISEKALMGPTSPPPIKK